VTFRTIDIDTQIVNGLAENVIGGSDSPARNVRSRRRSLIMGRHTSGSRISGFGI